MTGIVKEILTAIALQKRVVISINHLVTSIAFQFNNMPFHTILLYSGVEGKPICICMCNCLYWKFGVVVTHND